jgi:hypothetical protein
MRRRAERHRVRRNESTLNESLFASSGMMSMAEYNAPNRSTLAFCIIGLAAASGSTRLPVGRFWRPLRPRDPLLQPIAIQRYPRGLQSTAGIFTLWQG